MAILILDKIYVMKNITGGYFIKINGPIQQLKYVDDKYEHNNIVSKYTKQKWTDLKKK